MTERQYKKKHFYLWNRIVKYLFSKEKGEEIKDFKSILELKLFLINQLYEEGLLSSTDIYNNCFACDFAKEQANTIFEICYYYCPLIEKLEKSCNFYSSKFNKLCHAYEEKDYEEAIQFAKDIRDAWR